MTTVGGPAVFQHVLDQIDATPRAVEFVAQSNIGRASGRAEAAMHTFAQDLLDSATPGSSNCSGVKFVCTSILLRPCGPGSIFRSDRTAASAAWKGPPGTLAAVRIPAALPVCSRRANQSCMTSAIFADQRTYGLRFWLTFHAQPDEAALPIVEGIDSGAHAKGRDKLVGFHRHHGYTPYRALGAVGKGDDITDFLPELARYFAGKFINRARQTPEDPSASPSIGDRGRETFKPQQRRASPSERRR